MIGRATIERTFGRQLLVDACGVGRGHGDIVPRITGPISCNLRQLVANCRDLLNSGRVRPSVTVRKRLCEAVVQFHNDAGLHSDISRKLSQLSDPETVVLRVAHQPNIFPYIGVVGQFALMHALARELEQTISRPVCEVFLFVDYDSARDTRFRTAQLGCTDCHEGKLLVTFPISSTNLHLPMRYVSKPSELHLKRWIDCVDTWGRSNLSKLRSLGYDVRGARSIFNDNIVRLVEQTSLAIERASTFSDFNAFFVAKIVEDLWGYPTLFARLSDFQPGMIGEYEHLLSKMLRINEDINEAKRYYASFANTPNSYYSKLVPRNQVPLWYRCETCHSRIAMSATSFQPFEIRGQCPNRICQRNYRFMIGSQEKPDLKQIIKNAYPRIEFQNLCLLPSLGVTAALGYYGSADHMLVTYYVARRLGLTMPVMSLTKSAAIYAGLEQLRASRCLDQNVFRLLASGRLSSLDIFLNFGFSESERILSNAVTEAENLMQPLVSHESRLSIDSQAIRDTLRRINQTPV